MRMTMVALAIVGAVTSGVRGEGAVRSHHRADLAGEVDRQVNRDISDLYAFYTDLHTGRRR